MNRQTVGNLVVGELRQQELIDRALLQIGIEQSPIDARWIGSQGQIAKNVLPNQLRNGRAAIDESAGDRDSIAMIIFKRSAGAGNRINQTRRTARAVGADGAGVSPRAGHSVEEEGSFLHRPAVVAT